MVAVRVYHSATGQRVFGHDLFIGVAGGQRSTLSLQEIFRAFRHRFDLEVSNRFQKQCLFLESFQTPMVAHLDNWVLVVQMAMWLLYVSCPDVGYSSKKWQTYSEPVGREDRLKTVSQTKKGAERLFCSFDSRPFLPGKYKKGLGRKKGETQPKRVRFSVVKKDKKAVKRE